MDRGRGGRGQHRGHRRHGPGRLRIGPILDKIRCKKGIVLAAAVAGVASGLSTVAGWTSDRIGGLGVVLLVVVRSLAGLGYAEQAINATYLNELVAQAHADPWKAKRRGS